MSLGQSQCCVKALRAVDILAFIKYSELALVPVKRWDGREGCHALGDFSSTVCGDRIKKITQKVGTFCAHFIVNCVSAHQKAFAAVFRVF